jgi:hypothetical protein
MLLQETGNDVAIEHDRSNEVDHFLYSSHHHVYRVWRFLYPADVVDE